MAQEIPASVLSQRAAEWYDLEKMLHVPGLTGHPHVWLVVVVNRQETCLPVRYDQQTMPFRVSAKLRLIIVNQDQQEVHSNSKFHERLHKVRPFPQGLHSRRGNQLQLHPAAHRTTTGGLFSSSQAEV
jgi:hypothetical protein